MQATTAPGQSATLPSADSMHTKTLSMTKLYGWISPSSVSNTRSSSQGGTMLMVSRSHLLQYIQPLHRPRDARPGRNAIYISTSTIYTAATKSVEHSPPTTRSDRPASLPRSRGSVRCCAVCTPRSKYDTPTDIVEREPFRQSF